MAWLSPLLLLRWEPRGQMYLAAPLPLQSIDFVAPRSPSMLSDTAFVLHFFMFILFHLDSSLCSVSPSSRTPTLGADLILSSAMEYSP
jgi:hypothetical protein